MSNLDKKLNQQEQTNAPVRKIEMSNGGNIPSFFLEKKKFQLNLICHRVSQTGDYVQY